MFKYLLKRSAQRTFRKRENECMQNNLAAYNSSRERYIWTTIDDNDDADAIKYNKENHKDRFWECNADELYLLAETPEELKFMEEHFKDTGEKSIKISQDIRDDLHAQMDLLEFYNELPEEHKHSLAGLEFQLKQLELESIFYAFYSSRMVPRVEGYATIYTLEAATG